MKNKTKSGSILELFGVFFKIGAITFGGGYAMIPLIERETVENRSYVTSEDLVQMVAVAESTPGPIAINAATFVGQRVAGFWGALAATLGVILPSFLIISLLSPVLLRFWDQPVVRYAFVGIRAGVLALICKALLNMYKKSKKNGAAYVLMALSFVAVAVLKVPPVAVVALCALAGIGISLWSGRKV